MAYTGKEMAKLAEKLRAGEIVEIDGVRVRAHKLKYRNVLACSECEVKCELVDSLATICALTDKYEGDPLSDKLSEYHYMEYADQED